MDYSSSIINQIIDNFNFAYIVSVNILTYIIIKIIDYLNGNKQVSILVKRLILLIAIIVLGMVYFFTGEVKLTILVNSAIAAPIAWSWILRPIVRKLGYGYKQNKNK